MPLIKAQQAERVTDDAIVLDLGDLHRQGEQLKSRAKQIASDILREAQDQARQMTAEASESGQKQGYDAGYAQGLAEGRQAGADEALQQHKQQFEALSQTWATALDQWNASREHMMVEARQQLLHLACDLARRIVHRLPQIDPAVIEDQLAAAVGHVTHPSDMMIRIHPEDRPRVEQVWPKIAKRLNDQPHVQWIEDDQLTRGGCIVKQQAGEVDATLEVQLQRMIELILPDAAKPTEDQDRTAESKKAK